MTSLVISWNELGPEGGKAIAAALPFMSVLKKLNIDGFELNIEQLTVRASTLSSRLTSQARGWALRLAL